MFGFDSGYFMFMAEEEGMLTTHYSKIKKACKEFSDAYRMGYNINSEEVQDMIFDSCGLAREDITSDDIAQIERAIRGW